MDANENERDEVSMLSVNPRLISDDPEDSSFYNFTSRARSASMSARMSSSESWRESNFLGHTGPLRSERTSFVQMSGPLYVRSKAENSYDDKSESTDKKLQLNHKYPVNNGIIKNEQVHDSYPEKNEHLLRSGQLGMCNDPYCTTCPSYYNYRLPQGKFRRTSDIFDTKFHNALYGDAKGWAKRLCSFLYSYLPGVMNPHARIIQKWNKFFVISCLVSIFIDPLFFFVLAVLKDSKCIVMEKAVSTTLVVFRSLTDFIYILHIILQFRLAYVAPESMVVGTGVLVDQPSKIARHYVTGYFFIDFFAALPIPQIIILFILPTYLGSSGANYAKNLLRFAILVQYIPRLYRFLPLLVGQSPIGFVFESAWENFVINLLTFVLSGHVVGSCWYLFGLQRVNQCLRDACHRTGNSSSCMKFIDCGYSNPKQHAWNSEWPNWTNNTNALDCFVSSDGSFDYGIYAKAVNLTYRKVVSRYIYSLFWGFQQISTLAGNLEPSYFVWEVLFTMAIIGLGLLLFALLIGNMQNFLQSLGRRRLEMSLRRRDVEQWMSHRRLPQNLRRKIIEAERYNWAATRGVNEEMLMENLPEDVQREIRRHLFKFVEKVRIFKLVDEKEPILDAVYERLKQKTYIKDSKILYQGGIIDKMVFIVRGKMESIGEDGIVVPLSEGDVCGEELLTWCLEHSSDNRDGKKGRIYGQWLRSNRTARCLTNVEAFILRVRDLEEVTSLFPRILRNPRIQGAIRYESPYYRCQAATTIQVAWRYRKKWLNRMETRSRSKA
ncbi:probable cyclic nucleotide-gated ion channel 20, chloroplastic isoform X1 [Chenopodium quinoa]|uniref:probable cyclic nucleotide-gated ion channel 20, chloroplastic isoform X1 n=1 Tax=Chenopodium quinoa TaxID=63459 RepID=UPI000B78BC4F|nr:probable cyclic nucleotide-gated ion channel 20, chloroplastic isoform X1 [Chenopodium quinoa]